MRTSAVGLENTVDCVETTAVPHAAGLQYNERMMVRELSRGRHATMSLWPKKKQNQRRRYNYKTF